MPPASERRTSFRHDEAFLPTLRSTLLSRRVVRGPGMPWWGAGLRGAVMLLLLVLCRRAGCHRRCLFVEGDRSAEHDINQIVFLFPRFTPTRVPLGSSNNYASSADLAPTVRVHPFPGALSLVKNPTLIGQCSCKLSLGGPALRRWLHHQRRAWTPLPSLLSRLVIK